MEEFHPDRGDTQRSVFVYQNLAVIDKSPHYFTLLCHYLEARIFLIFSC